ncbi:conserved hypothetical protein [Neospora caninum Liverpool]|uniref:Uncharacterized protein n=1 Tax=Neospora caninum (strain Liverpool) TaxID=572307 RepID=F0V7R0_NEOCL|nr:conserved hypothetical protein [Neospora caninum Liverpool]CBZ49751.1 conserved hypothetical protein [Neospora caninum Liverpool]CEL64336.1 TPA: hypothetical protein BN1204_002380 [Neospora caninum Liverpool]|eukprot:XP_003879786.1 conserved hypothetical protein [Neospora caninum Liverpool]
MEYQQEGWQQHEVADQFPNGLQQPGGDQAAQQYGQADSQFVQHTSDDHQQHHHSQTHYTVDDADCSTDDGDRTLSYMRKGTYVGEGKDYWPAAYSGHPGDQAGGFTQLRRHSAAEGGRPRIRSILKNRASVDEEPRPKKLSISFAPDQAESDAAAHPIFAGWRNRSFVFSEEKNGYVDLMNTNGQPEDIVRLDRNASVNRTIVDEIQDKLRARKLSTISVLWERYKSHGNMGDKAEGWAPNMGMPRVAMSHLPARYHVKYPGGAPRPTTCGTCSFCA